MKQQTALICLCLLLAPGPWGIALNHETKECGGYWPGDEYGGYELPVGWEAYYPGDDGIIQTEIGNCTYGSPRSSGDAESCCQELGYAYVGPNIGEARTSPLLLYPLAVYLCRGLAVLCAIGVAVVLVGGGGFFLWKRRRKKQKV
jgi:LPXTG-motif cell wall-anchored protein